MSNIPYTSLTEAVRMVRNSEIVFINLIVPHDFTRISQFYTDCYKQTKILFNSIYCVWRAPGEDNVEVVHCYAYLGTVYSTYTTLECLELERGGCGV